MAAVPPCAPATAATIASPRPVLPLVCPRELSPRANRSNAVGRIDSGTPGPSSLTAICTTPATSGRVTASAAEVIDYTGADFTTRHAHYDVILDNVGNHPLRRLRHALAPTGTLVFNAGGSPGKVIRRGGLVTLLLVNGVVRQRLRPVPTNQNRDDLIALRRLVADGKLRPVIGRTYPLRETAAGLRHVERGHARGKLIITVP
jgi:NADPH:quinone reductase-like Zn-dependent oxidoreductase